MQADMPVCKYYCSLEACVPAAHDVVSQFVRSLVHTVVTFVCICRVWYLALTCWFSEFVGRRPQCVWSEGSSRVYGRDPSPSESAEPADVSELCGNPHAAYPAGAWSVWLSAPVHDSACMRCVCDIFPVVYFIQAFMCLYLYVWESRQERVGCRVMMGPSTFMLV